MQARGFCSRGSLPSCSRPLLAIIVAGAITTLVAGSLWQSPSRRAAFDAARADGGASDLDLVRPYLAELDGARVVMFATTFGMSKLFQWMLREHCRCKIIVEDPGINGAQSREQVRDMMADRVARSRADVLVVIDAPTSPYSLAALGWIYDKMAGIPDAMAQQTRFVQFTAYALPGLGARATLWRKVERTGARGDMTAERAAPRFLDSRMARR